jgi:hypothetical protein
MRFYKGIRFGPRRPRGKGRGTYRVSRRAYQARLRNLGHVARARSYSDTRRLEIEVALGTHRGESTRAMAKRVRCSHVHCWRVARRYRLGLLPLLPRDLEALTKFRDSVCRETTQPVPWWLAREWRSRDEIWGCILLTQEQKKQASAEFERRDYARLH